MTLAATLSLVMPGSRWHGRNAADGVPLEALDESEMFGLIDDTTRPLLETAMARHRATRRQGRRLTVIVAPASPPLTARREEPPIFSFLASQDIGRELVLSGQSTDQWCYAAMSRAANGARSTTAIAIVHKTDAPHPVIGDGDCEAILSHRGPERHLRLCVESLLEQTMPVEIIVCIDQKYSCPRFLADIADKPQVQAYQVSPFPAGPYAAYHIFGCRSRARYLARQDTDDLALPHRLAVLTRALADCGAGMVGSHEIQINEITRQVETMRYPLDVNEALRREGALNHQIMPRNSVWTRDTFIAAGGYSTERVFGHDVDFWTRAVAKRRGINIDEFLYVRRRHARSLTTRDDVGRDSELRHGVRRQRALALASILSGKKKIEDTSLSVRHRVGDLEFKDLRTGARQRVTPGTMVPA